MSIIRPVVLCGGSGTRLWPLSRRLEPKQFQKLNSDRSLFQDTLARFDGAEFGRATVLVNSLQEPRVQFDLMEMDHPAGLPRVLVEPAMRSTAPAIAAAALALIAEDPDAVMLVVPSDHRIGQHDRLVEAYRAALPFVENGGIALFGIRPSSPETGFGYIEAEVATDAAVHDVISFVEKPTLDVARELVAGGRHTWNSGIFMFRALTILSELSHRAPALLETVTESIREGRHDGNSFYLSPRFADSPEISVDHAVMEHSSRLGVIPVSPDWNDLGSFEALWEVGKRDQDNNVVKGNVLLSGVQNSYIHGAQRLVSVIGLTDVVVVDTDDVLLVTTRTQSQDVKHVAQHLAKAGHPAADRHLTRQDMTGRRRIIDKGEHYLVERIEVVPGAAMLLEMTETGQRRMLTLVTGEVVLDSPDRRIALQQGACLELGSSSTITIHNPMLETATLILSMARDATSLAAGSQEDFANRSPSTLDIRKAG
ncbi:mannose-1-phosphate guanylyltransferase/mannose-6-phosphate isomerase [Rhizobium sp. AQ_MP]|jgi:mannose-1-phosphate guanylyltransferase/mannose-6-phosphate isomerase|uniref:mannose-1-phosphate guanylyltransferase n=1 Tax=Rhizobium sp. AQ_MP TaxID=2761536 RepID=UPI001639B1EC|nr:sugar phosphate nucleotidyltransferase [Rhizobium sp. AQ_MP]MBC2774783.1 mannose-1-phosphate guanylyltransferase/mannose-6-phosphate isomerase [Rhizobium sp. AQ_MP]